MDETTTDPQSATQNGADPQAETATITDSSETQETTTATEQAQQQSADELQAQIKRLEAAIKKANAEAKAHRLERDELKKFKDQTEAATLSETEKRERERQALEKQLAEVQSERDKALATAKELRINQDIFAKAAKVGINPSLATKVLDHSEIDYDDNGNPTNVEDLLKSLLKEFPNLAAQQNRTPASSGGATNPGRTQTTNAGQTLSWDLIGKMSPDEYSARRTEITQWMAKNMPR